MKTVWEIFVMTNRIKTNWDSIPTQSIGPLSFDNGQRRTKKRGTPGGYRDTTLTCAKTTKGRKAWGGQQHHEKEFYPGLSPVYESPQDRVFRNGKYVEIKELNKETWAEKKKARKNKGGIKAFRNF